MKQTFTAVLFLFTFWFTYSAQAQNSSYDLVVYGGTSGGVAAAIQISRMGKSVLLIEPSNHLGGLTTGGLGATDIGNKNVIGGISKEFYQNVKAYYDDPEKWKYEDRSDYLSRPDQTRSNEGEDAMWTFEPSVAMKVYEKMLADEDIKVIIGKRLNRESGVKSKNNKITSITMESGETYTGKMFMDATYEGDLMAASGVSYTTGREANSQYGETLNGVQANFYNLTLKGNVSRNAIHHNFVPGVDPYVVKGDPSSGLLPFIIEGGPGLDGTADKGIQAYCYRMTLTNEPENRIPFEKPAKYNELEYELLFRNYEAANGPIEKMYHYGDPLVPWINTPMPNKKTDTNNQKGFSTDFIGQNFDYPEASYAEREAFSKKQLEYQQGLMWTLAYHPRIPKKVRDVVSQWGMPKDEFTDRNGWTPQLYVREARRMVSDYVVTQADCEGLVPQVEDGVGMGSYGMDSHMVQRYVDHNGYVQNEGNFEARGLSAYPISYRSIVPKKGEKENLLVPVCISATHVAFGSARMEPVFMVLGQSAATAASLAIDHQVAVQDLDYDLLVEVLLKDNQILEYAK
ncbi:FAD-dependent oxidoreductase [uncultured Cyclobacterium sp.]|uniref:FAD-dependent oxidoreductase n=1 Tax=uncultured Cyclobacterium sp. TaxID=453820 RepID=UPI0030EB45D0|tara:strand:+ start:160844 stop:162556 length:1713 start_codon:yes stop_codon:yes gene_type:complete